MGSWCAIYSLMKKKKTLFYSFSLSPPPALGGGRSVCLFFSPLDTAYRTPPLPFDSDDQKQSRGGENTREFLLASICTRTQRRAQSKKTPTKRTQITGRGRKGRGDEARVSIICRVAADVTKNKPLSLSLFSSLLQAPANTGARLKGILPPPPLPTTDFAVPSATAPPSPPLPPFDTIHVTH